MQPSSSPREHSPVVTDVSALSTPTDASADAAETPPPTHSSPQHVQLQHAVVETLSDTGDDGEDRVDQQSVNEAAYVARSAAAEQKFSVPSIHVPAADYADRRRLLNHITYLSTQLQRAQLQVEDLTRTVCILRGIQSDEGSAVRAAAVDGATSAAVLAARDEAEIHTALQSALAAFDPVIAQTQIYRLDDALAQLSLLREAELAQLQSVSVTLDEHRVVVSRLSAEAAHLRNRNSTLEQQKSHAEMQLKATTLELQRLRHEELRLNQRVAGLQELAQDGTWMSNVRIVDSAQNGRAIANTNSISSVFPPPLARLVEEEQLARQELLLDVFWEPILIAFDAGLTWLTDSAALRNSSRRTAATAVEDVNDQLSLVQAGIVVDAAPPPSDADLLLLRRQQEEVTELRARVQLLDDRNRIAELEKERLQFLYESEMRRSERMAQDHVLQLQQAYDEVVKDRQCIMNKLKSEVEEQLRLAFEEGRAYEKNRSGGTRSRSRPTKKALRSSSAVT